MTKEAERIDMLRSSRGWSYYKLAHLSKVSEPTFNKWIHNGAKPTLDCIKKVCRAFGITLSEFFLEGEIVEFTPERKELLEKWGSLTEEERTIVRSVIDGFADKK